MRGIWTVRADDLTIGASAFAVGGGSDLAGSFVSRNGAVPAGAVFC